MNIRMSASAVTGLVTVSYIGLYTAYDKQKKRLDPGLVKDFVLLKRGLNWTLVEANKAISLSRLTVVLLSYLPAFGEVSAELLYDGMSCLWVHSVYSFYKFYGLSPMNVLKDKTIKQVSVGLGVAGQAALAGGFYGYISDGALIVASTVLSLTHFWTMEVDYKMQLKVRPYAYLPFVLGVPVFVEYLRRK